MLLTRSIFSIFQNGMLYKDVTQWLRQKTFVALFLALLGFCEAIAVILSTVTLDDPGEAGVITFGLLCAALGLYALAIAVTGHIATAREFNDRTFELYTLAGMSLEKMALGKALSMMAQFLFGASCIVPFMLFAYLLGGLDFIAIIVTLILAMLLAPPLFLFSLLSAAYQKQKSLRVITRVFAVLAAMFILPNLLSVVFLAGMGGRGSGLSITGFFADLDAGKWQAWIIMVTMPVIYAQGIALMFFLCAQAMRPSTDSREHWIKLLCFSIASSVAALFFISTPGSDKTLSMFGAFCIALFVLILWLGVTYFYQQPGVPVMIRAKQNSLKRAKTFTALLKSIHLFWFEPGPRGYLRTLLLFLALPIVMAAWQLLMLQGMPDYHPTQARILRFISFPLSAPFFLLLPSVFIYSVNHWARTKYTAVLTVFYWIFSGTVLQIVTGTLKAQRHFEGFQAYMLIWIGALVSPVSTLFAEVWGESFGLQSAFYGKRMLLGAVGLLLLFHTLRRREKLAVPTAAPTPSPLPAAPQGNGAVASAPPAASIPPANNAIH